MGLFGLLASLGFLSGGVPPGKLVSDPANVHIVPAVCHRKSFICSSDFIGVSFRLRTAVAIPVCDLAQAHMVSEASRA